MRAMGRSMGGSIGAWRDGLPVVTSRPGATQPHSCIGGPCFYSVRRRTFDVNGRCYRRCSANESWDITRGMTSRATSSNSQASALGDQNALFLELFSTSALVDRFHERLSRSPAKGLDRLNGVQYSKRAAVDLTTASRKCLDGSYRFTPYCENLRLKGRDSVPRVISVPTLRDRIVLAQLNKFLSSVFPECRPPLASARVRELAAGIPRPIPVAMYVCATDIKQYYDSIKRSELLALLSGRVNCWQVRRLVKRSIQTPTVALNARRQVASPVSPTIGVPQGLAISNLLASIYLRAVDAPMQSRPHTFIRYVDDILMLGSEADVRAGHRSLRSRNKIT